MLQSVTHRQAGAPYTVCSVVPGNCGSGSREFILQLPTQNSGAPHVRAYTHGVGGGWYPVSTSLAGAGRTCLFHKQ